MEVIPRAIGTCATPIGAHRVIEARARLVAGSDAADSHSAAPAADPHPAPCGAEEQLCAGFGSSTRRSCWCPALACRPERQALYRKSDAGHARQARDAFNSSRIRLRVSAAALERSFSSRGAPVQCPVAPRPPATTAPDAPTSRARERPPQL